MPSALTFGTPQDRANAKQIKQDLFQWLADTPNRMSEALDQFGRNLEATDSGSKRNTVPGLWAKSNRDEAMGLMPAVTSSDGSVKGLINAIEKEWVKSPRRTDVVGGKLAQLMLENEPTAEDIARSVRMVNRTDFDPAEAETLANFQLLPSNAIESAQAKRWNSNYRDAHNLVMPGIAKGVPAVVRLNSMSNTSAIRSGLHELAHAEHAGSPILTPEADLIYEALGLPARRHETFSRFFREQLRGTDEYARWLKANPDVVPNVGHPIGHFMSNVNELLPEFRATRWADKYREGLGDSDLSFLTREMGVPSAKRSGPMSRAFGDQSEQRHQELKDWIHSWWDELQP